MIAPKQQPHALPINIPSGHGKFPSAALSRRGTLFHHTLIYMTIASALMTLGGLCLHTMLKADVSQRRDALFLSSLLRLEDQLREDSRDDSLTLESESTLIVTRNDGTMIRWNSERSILHRRLSRGEETLSADRFIFPAGSQIQFESGDENSVIVRIIEPSVFVTYAAAADGGSNLRKPAEEATPKTPAHVAQPGIAEIRLKGGPR
jgi:hypothetical protein